jgi:hypothetical protein
MNRDYQVWIRANEPGPEQLRALRHANTGWTAQPRISILTPVYNPAPAHLAEFVSTQAYDNWEHCLADGGSTGSEIRRLLEDSTKCEPRYKVPF